MVSIETIYKYLYKLKQQGIIRKTPNRAAQTIIE